MTREKLPFSYYQDSLKICLQITFIVMNLMFLPGELP